MRAGVAAVWDRVMVAGEDPPPRIIARCSNGSHLQPPNARPRYDVTRRGPAARLPDALDVAVEQPSARLPADRATGFAKCPYCSAEYVLTR